MERSFKVDAVILSHQDYGEADRIINLYTRERGKIHVIAKGIRKIHSRKAGHLEPFTHVSLLIARGQAMPIITQAETLHAFLPLRDDLLRLGYASYVIELVDRFTYEEEENQAVFDLLLRSLALLQEPSDPIMVLRCFEIHLLDRLGFKPNLFQCVGCGAEIIAQDQYFSAEMGGVLCPRCGLKYSQSRPISMNTLRYLRHFQRNSFEKALSVQIPGSLHPEMELIMQYYLTFLLERNLNTPFFLRRIIKDHKDAGH